LINNSVFIRAIFTTLEIVMKRTRFELSATSFVLFAFILSSLLIAAAGSMPATARAEDATPAFKTIPVSEANELLGKIGVIFLDVREPGEFQSSHAPGAMNIPLGNVEAQIEKQVPDKATTVVVYCQGGRRSITASQMLIKMGYKNVLNMDGGWKAWLKAGYSMQQILEKSK
jgi:rhodanese-related sulfurtransferase